MVGGLYISIDVYRLIRSVLYSNNHDDNGDKGTTDDTTDTTDKDNDDDGKEDEDPVGASVLSLFFTLFIWSVCFFRAFQFRYHLHVALSQEGDNSTGRPPEAEVEEIARDLPQTAQAQLV